MANRLFSSPMNGRMVSCLCHVSANPMRRIEGSVLQRCEHRKASNFNIIINSNITEYSIISINS